MTTQQVPWWVIPLYIVMVVVFPLVYPVLWLSDRRDAKQWAALEGRGRAAVHLEAHDVVHARWWTRGFASIAEGTETMSIFELGLADGSVVLVIDDIGHCQAMLTAAGKLPEPVPVGHSVEGLPAVTWLVSTAVLGIATAFVLAVAC